MDTLKINFKKLVRTKQKQEISFHWLFFRMILADFEILLCVLIYKHFKIIEAENL